MQPKVTIILLNDNEEKKEESLKSILEQRYENFKVIICGKDWDVQHDKVITVQNKEEKFVRAKCLNQSLQLVEDDTKYVGFVTTDDFLKPTYIAKCVTALLVDPEFLSAVYTDYSKDFRHYLPSFERRRFTTSEVPPLNSVIKLETLIKIGEFDSHILSFEEWDYWLRISELGMVYHIPENLYTTTKKDRTPPSEKFRAYILNKASQRMSTNGKRN